MIEIKNESNANPSDVNQAKEFLKKLPPACSNSTASVSEDGTITIKIKCQKSGDGLDGEVSIKDGVVKEII